MRGPVGLKREPQEPDPQNPDPREPGLWPGFFMGDPDPGGARHQAARRAVDARPLAQPLQ
jgi:hypothetical protein